MNNFVFLGPPGAGKGSLAVKVAEDYKIPHISTGDIFRANIKAQTPLGVKVKAIIDSGSLVSDELTFELVKDRLAQDDCKNGYILDGFPRTIAQAQALDEMLAERGEKVNYVIGLEVDDAELINRIVERGKTSGRSDDNVETAKKRLETYYAQTLPLKEFYVSQGKYVKINGVGSIDEIYSEIRNTLK